MVIGKEAATTVKLIFKYNVGTLLTSLPSSFLAFNIDFDFCKLIN